VLLSCSDFKQRELLPAALLITPPPRFPAFYPLSFIFWHGTAIAQAVKTSL
jgi:hypothetical protein